eukprot:1654367-Pyramimonas_sp.AAC.1
MAEHQGAVGLRGEIYATTQRRKETCSDASVQAEVSYLHPTSLRFHSPEVHPPTPIGNFFEDIMHGSMRYDILLPPTPRILRQNNKSHDRLHPTTTYEAIGLGLLSLGSHGSLWGAR